MGIGRPGVAGASRGGVGVRRPGDRVEVRCRTGLWTQGKDWWAAGDSKRA